MTTDNRLEVTLRPVIARLRDLEKKCASMGSRNEEFPLMQERLASIIKRLAAGREPSGAPLAYRAIAREIFPVAHLFESVGFLSVGKEVAHIEKVLSELDPEPPVAGDDPATRAPVQSASSSARISSSSSEPPPDPPSTAEEKDDTASGSGLPWPVLIAFFVLLIALAVAAALIFKIGPFRESPTPPIPSATATVPIAATQSPLPTSPPAPQTTGPPPAVRLADELSQARLAIAHEDLAAAVSHLSAAAMIDRDNTTVLEIAEQLVHRLVEKADSVTQSAQWTEAEQLLERARRIAMRFGIETAIIDRTARRHAEMERFSFVDPGDIAAIRAATGKRALVTLLDGDRRSGRIEGLGSGVLLLVVDSDVGGGVVRYTGEIPLADIASIKIFED